MYDTSPLQIIRSGCCEIQGKFNNKGRLGPYLFNERTRFASLPNLPGAERAASYTIQIRFTFGSKGGMHWCLEVVGAIG